MVVSHMFCRSSSIASQIIRTKFFENVAQKRLFIDSMKPLMLFKKRYSAYDGDGRTVGCIISKKNAEVFMISQLTTNGFYLTNGTELVGSLIMFPHSIMSWNVLNASGVNEDSLSLFKLLDPKIDILIFGYGSSKEYTPEIRQRFPEICKKLGLRYEALPTEHAIGVYNFLADERRLVAAALIPPSDIRPFRYLDERPDLLEDLETEEQEALPDNKISDRKLIH